MARLDVKLDALLNLRGEIIGLFAGDPIVEHREGVKLAREVYATPSVQGMDIVVINAYSKPNECAIAPFIGIPSLKDEGGDLVVIANEPAGQIVHYLFGNFGKHAEGKLQFPPGLRAKVGRLIVLSPFKDHAGASFFGKLSLVQWVKTWEETLDLLQAEWGNQAKVAIYPDGTLQYAP